MKKVKWFITCIIFMFSYLFMLEPIQTKAFISVENLDVLAAQTNTNDTFILRIAVSLIIPLLIALLFKYRSIKDLFFIFFMFLVPLTTLNLLLSIAEGAAGNFAEMYTYIAWALFVILAFMFMIIELAVFIFIMGFNTKGSKHPIVFAVFSNILSIASIICIYYYPFLNFIK